MTSTRVLPVLSFLFGGFPPFEIRHQPVVMVFQGILKALFVCGKTFQSAPVLLELALSPLQIADRVGIRFPRTSYLRFQTSDVVFCETKIWNLLPRN